MFKVIAFANTFAIIDLILHPFFHLWVLIAPRSFEWVMHLFVAGLNLQVTDFDTSLTHIALGTVIEASAFWILGFSFALIYNRLSKS
ncbi:MAG: hypothetical protein A2904_00440 [Candidatus Staskawiczbacteria bacterium RIFCSPLOWO2_01_FULL_33_9]|uniref:DUF2062 domain-containing protein n=1 Tax=Candidatus Staskawiczbacteria bacterium RIFCSPLOWO2_01_FULL_33_9 TaxID=1802211 RepID=A0A1G2I607_9BACT|nr:MAG: hypothetical protein A2904_00440 [Candidatus Staskawiczbacteria bacterium RIFCSPLOWO2_01_FULL_33_9]